MRPSCRATAWRRPEDLSPRKRSACRGVSILVGFDLGAGRRLRSSPGFANPRPTNQPCPPITREADAPAPADFGAPSSNCPAALELAVLIAAGAALGSGRIHSRRGRRKGCVLPDQSTAMALPPPSGRIRESPPIVGRKAAYHPPKRLVHTSNLMPTPGVVIVSLRSPLSNATRPIGHAKGRAANDHGRRDIATATSSK